MRDAKVTPTRRSAIDRCRSWISHSAFNRLVGWARAFKAGTIDSPTSDTYRDLCDSKAGVCRHRAFAFMITANALGIPTRYVENEAHAFVEVWFPERSWQRIDLGGAALRMDVSGADNKTLHRPRADDPFTKPPEYKQNYTQLEGDIRGLSRISRSPTSTSRSTRRHRRARRRPRQRAAARRIRITPRSDAAGRATQDPAKPTPTLARHAGVDQRVSRRRDPRRGHRPRRRQAGPRSPRPRLPRARRRRRVSPFRSRSASAKTTADGTFREDFSLPPTLNLSTYEIYLSSYDDAYYNAALSD